MANITFKQFTKCCFILWFYNFIKKMGKRKKEGDAFFEEKKQKQKKKMISADGKWTFL